MASPSKSKPADDRLPFEPKRRQKRAEKEPEGSAPAPEPQVSPAARKREDAKAAKVQAAKEKLAKMQRRSAEPARRQGNGIPEDVSRRMLKRMVILSGIPMALGVSVFFISYYVVSRDLLQLPTVAVLLVSLGFFGLSVLGLSYGVLSASWEEGGEAGSLLGWQEFRLNFGRLLGSWKDSKQQKS